MIKLLMLSTLMLWSAFGQQQEENIKGKLIQPISTVFVNTSKKLLVSQLQQPTGDYYPEEDLSVSTLQRNPYANDTERFVEWSIYDDSGNKVYSVEETIIIPGRTTLDYKISWNIPTEIRSGRYYSKLRIWRVNVRDGSNMTLLENRDDNGFLVYRRKEEFDSIDETIWGISSKQLGRSQLRKENVIAQEGYLTISLPQGSVNGGEIYTRQLQSYGIYEARMKLPKALTSITGFFFYHPPDYYYEIDIEVLNDNKGTLYLTAYHEGKVSRQYSGTLGFDPTMDFHDYRIEYQEDELSFYVDDQLMKAWNSGFPKEPMYLYINSWFPTWLDGLKPEKTAMLSIDWVKY